MKRAILMLAVLALWSISSNAFAGPVGSTLSGEVFDDLSGSSINQPGDPGLQGWTVDLLDNSGNLIATTTSAADGSYSFANVPQGTFTVQEELQPGWIQTAPAPPGTYTETTVSGQDVSSLDFGNYQLVSVNGEVYNDLNNNGNLDPGEPSLQGWTVNLLDNSGNLIATTISDANGNYTFANLGPGTYSVEEVLQNGWNLTQPINPDLYSFTAQSGLNETGLNFGNFSPSVATPEPSTLTLLGIGAICSLGYSWRRRKQAVA